MPGPPPLVVPFRSPAADVPIGRQPVRNDIGIVALVPDRWGPWWQPRHHVLTRLASHFKVVWVEPAAEWREVLWGAKGLPDPSRGPPPPRELLVDAGMSRFPQVHSPAFLGRWLQRRRLQHLVARLRRRGCRRLLLYVWRPDFADAVEAYPWDAVVYHIDDEYTFSPEDQPVPETEARLLERADTVFIHSPALWQKKAALTRRPFLIPNGVPYHEFAFPVPVPGELATIRGPRIGYAGWLKDQLDWELIEGLVDRHPDWSWVFIGPEKQTTLTEVAVARLKHRPNVHFIGPRPASSLGAYVQHLDVGIMPYRIDGYTKYIYPMKLHEYLAAGLPAVGTPIPSLLPHAGLVRLEREVEGWSAALTEALDPAARAPHRVEERRAVAQAHDWDRLAGTIADHILAALHGRAARP